MTTLLQVQSSSLRVHEQLEYPEVGILSKVLLQDVNCQSTLFCLAAGTDISEYTATPLEFGVRSQAVTP